MPVGTKICKHSSTKSCNLHNLQCGAPDCFINSETGKKWEDPPSPKQVLRDDLIEYFEQELLDAETSVVATSSYPADAAWNADCIQYRDKVKDLLERIKKYYKN